MPTLDRREFLAGAAGSLAALAILPDILPAAPRSADPLLLAVIGAGRQGLAAVTELQKLDACRIAGVCDLDQGRIDRAMRRLQGAEGFTDYRRLLDTRKDIGGVIIATPTHEHKEIALAALAAGKHVYCETPLAHTPEDCRAIAMAARNAGSSIFAAGFEGRSNPVYKLARSFFRSDSVRDLITMRAQHHMKNSWRVPANTPERERAFNWRLDKELSIGLAGELGSHQFDVIHWYRSAYPAKIRGSGGVRFHHDGREVADTVRVDLEFADGVVLQYDATLANSFEGRYELFCGSNASIKLGWSHGWMFKEADAPTQGWEVYANRQQFHNDEGITLIAGATKLAEQGKLKEGVGLPHSPLYYALADFLTSVIESQPPACSAEEALRSTIVGILANQAVRTGQTISIDDSTLKAS